AERILKIHSPLSLIANSYLEVDKLKERLNFAIKTKLNKEKKKEKTDQKKNNPPMKSKKKSKLSEIITYSNIMEIINKFINLKFKPILNFNSKLEYSLNDAAKTALSYGILSTLPSLIYFFIKILFKPKKYNFDILPKFDNAILLKFEIKSIIFISFANIIYMMFVLLKYCIYILHKNKKNKFENINKE
ncbi:DUF2953 domain-containing protein, partial [Clostridium butyricum]|uniref:DUF2953 domain-containing protein n=1 Tax=Clostridium butyricum TaxID=1492 RepID=UPI0034E44647